MNETKTFNKAAFEQALGHFFGTNHWYKTMIPGITYTDGVKFVADECGAYWLIDVIISHQTSNKVRNEEFQVWELKKTGESSAVVRMQDGNGVYIIEQEIEYTDFPLEEMKLWYTNKVILLPSEY